MQRRVLIRARGLASFRNALRHLAVEGGVLATRRRVVVVPTRASAELLRQTIEASLSSETRPAVVLPDMLTRDEWLGRLFEALPPGRRWLSKPERLVLLERAARETLERRRLAARPFHLRPGLVAAMLDFHDELSRRQRSVRRFARTLFDELRVERGTDRGSESLINQTCFLGLSFLAYGRAVAESGGVDEHALRAALLASQPRLPFDDLVIAVADHPADLRGLWPADFDLVGRLQHLQQVRVVLTDEAHDAGFRERLEEQLPGIEEDRTETIVRSPKVVVGAPGQAAAPVFLSRDREEEVRDVARTIRHRAMANEAVMVPAAIVFHRPLPYLYLAQQVLTDARVPYQAFDALPLAGEPYAALLDVVMSMARTGGTRDSTIALLRSPLLVFEIEGTPLSLRDVSVLEAVLTERRSTGDASTYAAEVDACESGASSRARRVAVQARRAARVAAMTQHALAPYRAGETATAQVEALSSFLRAHERRFTDEHHADDRARRARAAVLAVLDGLAEAFRRHDDHAREHDDLASIIHHAVESHTFMPRRGQAGVHLVDAVAARFGEFDDTYLVGLVETDWAERQRRSFFYSNVLLKALGWPQDDEQTRAQHAAFQDLLTLSRHRTRLSAFQLEGDAIVAVSPIVESSRGLPEEVEPTAPRGGLFPDERWTREGPLASAGTDGDDWIALRRRRPALDGRDYGGFVSARDPETYRVSKVDRYVACPFKYFAEHVLGLSEDRDEEAGLTPLERGTLLHSLFEAFYQRWQAAGHGAITTTLIPAAVTMFTDLMEQTLQTLPPADRVLEDLRLRGSMVAPGVAARVFELEAASGAAVRERLLEYELNGPFTFPVKFGFDTRTIEIRGKTDRIDVLGDGSLRVVDYKLGRMPDLNSSIQIAVYAHCAQAALEQRDGRPHPVSAAMYVAFGDDRRLEGRLPGDNTAMAVAAKASEFAGTIEKIEAGEFPPAPKKPSECVWCGFAGVCRKEYRIEDDEAAESV
ncbi:MAG: PD-(D/E)XK nuclease family protein [Acidobacteriota bacterium]